MFSVFFPCPGFTEYPARAMRNTPEKGGAGNARGGMLERTYMELTRGIHRSEKHGNGDG